jgi:hypothetical protein
MLLSSDKSDNPQGDQLVTVDKLTPPTGRSAGFDSLQGGRDTADVNRWHAVLPP